MYTITDISAQYALRMCVQLFFFKFAFVLKLELLQNFITQAICSDFWFASNGTINFTGQSEIFQWSICTGLNFDHRNSQIYFADSKICFFFLNLCCGFNLFLQTSFVLWKTFCKSIDLNRSSSSIASKIDII